MPCSCQEIEQQYGDSGCKCIHFGRYFPNCQCEAESVSDHSPGPVKGEELLLRTLYSPIHINPTTGDVNPIYFRDAANRGLSVNRKMHIDEAELRVRIEGKIARDRDADKKRDDFFRVLTARCDAVKGILEDGKRLFCVYDTAMSDDPSHADICQANDPLTKHTKAERMKMRSRLFESFDTRPHTLETVYQRANSQEL